MVTRLAGPGVTYTYTIDAHGKNPMIISLFFLFGTYLACSVIRYRSIVLPRVIVIVVLIHWRTIGFARLLVGLFRHSVIALQVNLSLLCRRRREFNPL